MPIRTLGIATAALLGTFALTSCVRRVTAPPPANLGALTGINMIPIWRHHPGRTWSAARYRSIAAKGFNSVRFVLHWDDFQPAPARFDRASLATLDTAVGRAKAAGLSIVLDEIHLWGPRGLKYVPRWARSGDSVASVQAHAAPYLRLLAARYRGEPAVAAYDPVSEPHLWPIDQNAVFRMYDGLIAAIRAVDSEKIVLVEPTYGDSSIAGRCADLANLRHRHNVVFSVHDYFAGGDRDGFGRGCGQAGRYTWNGRSGYRPADAPELMAHLRSYLDALRPAGVRLYVGEFGIGARAPHHDRWIKDTVAVMNRLRVSRAWWQYWTSAYHETFSATTASGRWRRFTDLLVAPRASSSR